MYTQLDVERAARFEFWMGFILLILAIVLAAKGKTTDAILMLIPASMWLK